MKKKSVVILSGGLDSATNLYWANAETEVILAITFNYGQRAAAQEIKASQLLTQGLGIKHQVIEAFWFKSLGHSSLVDSQKELPTGNDVDIQSQTQSLETMKSVWVPNRNGQFLNIAAGFAESLGADYVVPGFNLEEASTFPDNSNDYLLALNHCFFYSTRNHVEVKCWTIALNKAEIVSKAIELKVPLASIWPCYQNRDQWCGECESCLRSQRAFELNGLSFTSLAQKLLLK